MSLTGGLFTWGPCSSGLAAAPAAAQTITVTAPAGGANAVASANDYATTVLQDPWDMSQRTDVGWFVNSVDFPLAGFSSVNFANGVFSGTVSADPNIWLLETAFAGAAQSENSASTIPSTPISTHASRR